MDDGPQIGLNHTGVPLSSILHTWSQPEVWVQINTNNNKEKPSGK